MLCSCGADSNKRTLDRVDNNITVQIRFARVDVIAVGAPGPTEVYGSELIPCPIWPAIGRHISRDRVDAAQQRCTISTAWNRNKKFRFWFRSRESAFNRKRFFHPFELSIVRMVNLNIGFDFGRCDSDLFDFVDNSKHQSWTFLILHVNLIIFVSRYRFYVRIQFTSRNFDLHHRLKS